MTIPPRRNNPLLVLSAAVLGWVVTFLLDLREERRAVRENRARLQALFTPVEVIPVERLKPPGYDRRKPRQGVVTVSKRRVRPVPKPPPSLSRRKALGLGSHWPRGANQKRGRGWYRRIVW